LKRVIYAGAQVRHLFRIVDLDTGCEVHSVASDDKLQTGSDAEFASLRRNHHETWAALRSQHEMQAPVNGQGPESARQPALAGAKE
jgi:hypothetical protein